MAEDNLVLEQLRLLRADFTDTKADIREIKNRMTTREAGQATLLQHVGHHLAPTPNIICATTD